jgi:hypothetical protein
MRERHTHKHTKQDWPFNDGDPPPDSIISSWLTLVKSCFGDKKSDAKNKKCMFLQECVCLFRNVPS